MWTPFGLNGYQTFVNIAGYAKYGYSDSMGPFFFGIDFITQYNSSDFSTTFAYAQTLKEKETYKQNLLKDLQEWSKDVDSWKEMLDEEDSLIYSTFAFVHVVFTWTISLIVPFLFVQFVIYLTPFFNRTEIIKFADLTEEQRQRLQQKCTKQQESLLDNATLDLNAKMLLQKRLEFGLKVKNLKHGVSGLQTKALLSFCGLMLARHTIASLAPEKHTVVGIIGSGLHFVSNSLNTDNIINHNHNQSTNITTTTATTATAGQTSNLYSYSSKGAPCSAFLQLQKSGEFEKIANSGEFLSLHASWVKRTRNMSLDDLQQQKPNTIQLTEMLDDLTTTYFDDRNDNQRRSCYASMDWVAWFASNQANCMFDEHAVLLHQYNRHVLHWMSAGIAFYRKEFPGPHSIGAFINDNILYPDAHAQNRMAQQAYPDKFNELLQKTLHRNKSYSVVNNNHFLKNSNGKYDPKRIRFETFAAIDSAMASVLQSKEFQDIVRQHQHHQQQQRPMLIPTEAEVFDLLERWNISVSEVIVSQTNEYNIQRTFSLIRWQTFWLTVFGCAVCVLFMRYSVPTAVVPRALAGKLPAPAVPSVPAVPGEQSYYGHSISYDSTMSKRFEESKKQMHLHLDKHVRLHFCNVVRDCFSKQQCRCECLCVKHEPHIRRPCEPHPFVESWKLDQCNFCKSKVDKSRFDKESVEKEKILTEDANSHTHTQLHERGLTVEALVAFTYEHDCWNWPTWRVVRDIIKPATEATRCRYSDLPQMDGLFGPAENFISHCWASPFGDLVAAASCGANRKRRVWIDIFAVRQWPGNIADLDFRSVIDSKSMQAVVLSFPIHILSWAQEFSLTYLLTTILPHDERYSVPKPWTDEFLQALEKDPEARKRLPFKRLWCVVELSAAIQSGVPIVPRLGSHRQQLQEKVLVSSISLSLLKIVLLVLEMISLGLVSHSPWVGLVGKKHAFWGFFYFVLGIIFLFVLYNLTLPLFPLMASCQDSSSSDEAVMMYYYYTFAVIIASTMMSTVAAAYHYKFGWVSPFTAYASTLSPKDKVVVFDNYGASESVKNLAKIVHVQSSEATVVNDIKRELDNIVKRSKETSPEMSREMCLSHLNSAVRSAFVGAAEGSTTEIVHCVESAVLGEHEPLLNMLQNNSTTKATKATQEAMVLICARGRLKILNMLLDHRSDRVSELTKEALAINYRNCLQLAAKGNHASIVERLFLLLESDSVVSFNNHDLRQLLRIAVDCMDDTGSRLVAVIFDTHSNVFKLATILAAIEKACENENPEIVRRLLLHQSFDVVNSSTPVLQRALHIAVRHGAEKVVGALLEKNRYVDIRGKMMHAHLLEANDSVWEQTLALVRSAVAECGAIDASPLSHSMEATVLEVSHIMHPEKVSLHRLLLGYSNRDECNRHHSIPVLVRQQQRQQQLSWTRRCLLYLLFAAAIPFVVVEAALVLIVCYGIFGCCFFYAFSGLPWWSKIVWYQVLVSLFILMCSVITKAVCKKIGWNKETHPALAFLFSSLETLNTFILDGYNRTLVIYEYKAAMTIVCAIPVAFFLVHDAIQSRPSLLGSEVFWSSSTREKRKKKKKKRRKKKKKKKKQ